MYVYVLPGMKYTAGTAAIAFITVSTTTTTNVERIND